jgi:hypothetical protein
LAKYGNIKYNKGLYGINTQYVILDYSLGDTITLLAKSKNTKEQQRIIKLTQYPDEPERNTCEIANKILSLEYLQVRFIDTADVVETVTTVDGLVDGSKVDSIDWSQLQNVHIVIADIQDLSVVTARIGTLETTTAHITNGIIDNATIDMAKVNNLIANYAHITNGIIDNAVVGTAAIGTTQIADGSITDAKIVTLTANKINVGTLSVERLEIRGSNTSLVYAINSITGALQSQNVNTLNGEILTPRSITADRIVVDAITANEIAALTITATEIAANTITAAKMVVGTITAASGIIADAAITNAKIADASITSAKITNLTADKIVGGTLTLGGASNVNGVFTLKNGSGTIIGTFDNNGMKLADGYFVVQSILNQNLLTVQVATGVLTIMAESQVGDGYYNSAMLSGNYFAIGQRGYTGAIYSSFSVRATLGIEIISNGPVTWNTQGYTLSISQPPWIAPTLLNSWVNYGTPYATAGYFKDSLGIVHLQGLIKSGTISNSLPAFNLPIGYRPFETHIFAGSAADAFAEIRVDSEGQVFITVGSTTWVTLSNVIFRAEQ